MATCSFNICKQDDHIPLLKFSKQEYTNTGCSLHWVESPLLRIISDGSSDDHRLGHQERSLPKHRTLIGWHLHGYMYLNNIMDFNDLLGELRSRFNVDDFTEASGKKGKGEIT